MNDWFKWKGVKCTDHGICVLEQPQITLPAERTKFETVPGRSGSLTILEGEDVYDDVILTAQCMMRTSAVTSTLSAYLRGADRVTFANRPEGYYPARIVNQIQFDKILRGRPHRAFAVNFRCSPFLYLLDSSDITLNAPDIVSNPHGVRAEPIITVYGSGDIELVVGGTVISLEGIEDSVTLDTPALAAYKGAVTMDAAMTGEFPYLAVGDTAISWLGNVTRVVLSPNWRTL